tara:strand:+ start:599 stop:955 length:357 start_codon:yes stop_codon:yes gene_type:complete
MAEKELNFSDSEDEDEQQINEESQSIVIHLKKVKGNKYGTYLTGIPPSDGKTVKDVLDELKKEFVKKNSTGCSIKESKSDSVSPYLPVGSYLFLQGSHDDKLLEFLVDKGYSNVIVKS